jgi:hypothetical protein
MPPNSHPLYPHQPHLTLQPHMHEPHGLGALTLLAAAQAGPWLPLTQPHAHPHPHAYAHLPHLHPCEAAPISLHIHPTPPTHA